jgi:hypothetical protein
MTETTHTDFEIAIERELHGALDPADAKALAEHLLGCASCRAYQRTAMEMETDMDAAGSLLSQRVLTATLAQRVGERLESHRPLLGTWALFLVPLAWTVPTLFMSWLYLRGRFMWGPSLAVQVPCAIVVTLCVAWSQRTHRRAARTIKTALDDARADPRALHAILRDDLRAQIAWVKKKMVATLVIAVAFVLFTSLLLGMWSPPLRYFWWLLPFSELTIAMDLLLLRRQLAELDRP